MQGFPVNQTINPNENVLFMGNEVVAIRPFRLFLDARLLHRFMFLLLLKIWFLCRSKLDLNGYLIDGFSCFVGLKILCMVCIIESY
jgi:hypothetical protein